MKGNPMQRLLQRRRIRKQAKRLLVSIGQTSEQVARSLAAAGVRGVPSNAFECALAVYLGSILPADPGIEEIAVGTTKKTRLGPSKLIIRQGSLPRWTIKVRLTPAIKQFLIDFDSRRYVELLVERPSDSRSRRSQPDAAGQVLGS
jgi:hypothetical protein